MSDINKSGWRKIHNFFRYGLGYICRWVFIGIAFIYLISLTIALHEAINFQSSVEGMFTEKSIARRVLVELYKHINSDNSQGQKIYPVPIGTMAIRLDTLNNAVKELRSYDLTDKKPVNVDADQAPTSAPTQPSQSQNEKVNQQVVPSLDEIETEFENKIRDLQAKLDNLHGLLFENSPHIQIVENFMAIEEISDELKRYTIDSQVSEEDTEIDPKQASSPQTIPQIRKQDAKNSTAQEATQQEGTSKISVTPFANQAASEYRILIENLEGQMDELKAEVEAVKRELPKDTWKSYLKNVKGIEQEIEKLEKHRAAANNFNISMTKLVNLMHTLNEDMLDDRQKFKQDLFNEIQSNLQQLTTYKDTKRLQVEKVNQEASPFFDHAIALNGLHNTLKALEQNMALTDEYKEIAKLKEIAIEIKKMKASVSAINNLSNIEVKYLPSDTNQTNSQEEEKNTAELKFKRNLGVLSEAIIKLEKEFSAQKPEAMLALIIAPDPDAQKKANTILTDYRSLSEFDAILLPFQLLGKIEYLHNFGIKHLYNIGINTRYITTLSYESLTLLFVFVIGAIGSLLYITKHFLHQAIQGHGWLDPPTRPFSWYLFRPIFGIVVALAVYLMVKAGQLALGGSDSLGDLNLPIFSVVALFAGLLSWHALDAIESKGKKWFSSHRRRHMYAAGLKHALDIDRKSIAQCASQVGCSEEQVQRWIACRDRVTPEMQDRLITWLDLTVGELFRDDVPAHRKGDTLLLPEGPQDDAGEPKADAGGTADEPGANLDEAGESKDEPGANTEEAGETKDKPGEAKDETGENHDRQKSRRS